MKNHWFLHHSASPTRAPTEPKEAPRGPQHRCTEAFERHCGDQRLVQLLKACCCSHKRKPSKTIGFCTILVPPTGPQESPRRPQGALKMTLHSSSSGSWNDKDSCRAPGDFQDLSGSPERASKWPRRAPRTPVLEATWGQFGAQDGAFWGNLGPSWGPRARKASPGRPNDACTMLPGPAECAKRLNN